jgi:formate hydrogenlyase transcriptional activator
MEIESEEHTTLEQVERHHIRKTLEQVNWVVGGPRGAAHRLGLKRSTLYARMQKLGIFTAKQFAENAVVGAQH